MATITKRGKGYRIRVFLGYDTNGKQIERTMTWTPSPGMTEKAAYTEALRQSVLFEEKLKYADSCDGRIKFSDFADQWFAQYAEPSLRPKTVARYREMFDLRIRKYLGHMALEKIRPPHLLAFYRTLALENEPTSYSAAIDLRKIVSGRKLTNVKFAELTGLSLNTLRAAYNRQSISLVSAEKIAAALDIPLLSLFRPTDEPKKLSATTIHHHHSLISNMLNDAKNWGFINENPCSRIESPKADVPEIAFLDQTQAKLFIERLQQIEVPGFYRRPILVLILTGMRRSELCGLEWKDIDWNAKTIRISRTSQVHPKDNSVYTDKTKNRSSNRLIYVSDQVLAILREQWLWQKAQENLAGNHKTDHDRIFTKPDGYPLHPNRLTTWFHNFVKANPDLPQIHLHALRHTFASLAISTGSPVPVVSAILGHSKPSTTSDIYVHVIEANQVASAVQVGNLFSELL